MLILAERSKYGAMSSRDMNIDIEILLSNFYSAYKVGVRRSVLPFLQPQILVKTAWSKRL
jgi:hypothetical protein